MPIAKVGERHQITIPKPVFDELALEPGDLIEVTVQEGKGILVPKQLTEKVPMPKLSAKVGLIDPDQKYWWLEEWQKGEREAQRDIDAGRISPVFDNAKNAIAHLRIGSHDILENP